MGADVRITDPSVIDGAAHAMTEQRRACEQAVAACVSAVSSAEAQIARRHHHWEQQVHHLEELLAACMRDERNDCSGIAYALSIAKQCLQRCQDCAHRLARVSGEFHAASRRLLSLVLEHEANGISYARHVQQGYAALVSIAIMVVNVAAYEATHWPSRARATARGKAIAEEIALVQATRHGTRSWNPEELELLELGVFPKGYVGHHINSLSRFPDLADNPDNLRFVTWAEHWQLHNRDWHNATGGKMFNRASMAIQRASQSKRG